MNREFLVSLKRVDFQMKYQYLKAYFNKIYKKQNLLSNLSVHVLSGNSSHTQQKILIIDSFLETDITFYF